MSELAKALLAFQKNAPRIQKDSINPHFRSRFPSLHGLMDVVLPELNAQGVLLMQLPTVVDGLGSALRTVLTHAETGESVEDIMLLNAAKDDPQGQGSALTYARRYALMAALGLVADEDDDGNASSGAGRTATGTDSPAGSPQAGSTPAPDNPADAARAAQEAAKEARTPTDDGSPHNVVLPFGKHKGATLGQVPHEYVEWLVSNFEPRNAEQRRVIAAAQLIVTGEARDPDDDIPF